jgi:fumarate reductase flavoprotein subunit
MHNDVIVIGAGLAGMTAAVRIAELRLKVLLLEQGEGTDYPCNTRYSAGIIHVCFRDVTRPEHELFEAIQQTTDGATHNGQAHAVATDARRAVQWLQSQGVRFMRYSYVEAYRWCMAPPRRPSAGPDWQGRGPDVALRLLAQRLAVLGGQMSLGAQACELLMEDGRCVGVSVARAGKTEVLRSASVIIADGGFQADRDLFQANIGKGFDKVLQRGAANSRGDGLRMAVKAGAAQSPMCRFYGHLLAEQALVNPLLSPYPQIDDLATAGIVVDAGGRRITDEGTGGIAIANALARRDDPRAIAVFDAAVWDGVARTARIPTNPLFEKAGGTLYRANSIEALAGMLEISAAALAAAIAAHNDAIAHGTGQSLTPPRSSGAYKPLPIAAVPFMAIRVCSGITYTMGGIMTDGFGQVLRADGAVIPGLFAAGAATGGLEGGGVAGYVGGLAKSGAMGLRTAERAADIIRCGSVKQ